MSLATEDTTPFDEDAKSLLKSTEELSQRLGLDIRVCDYMPTDRAFVGDLRAPTMLRLMPLAEVLQGLITHPLDPATETEGMECYNRIGELPSYHYTPTSDTYLTRAPAGQGAWLPRSAVLRAALEADERANTLRETIADLMADGGIVAPACRMRYVDNRFAFSVRDSAITFASGFLHALLSVSPGRPGDTLHFEDDLGDMVVSHSRCPSHKLRIRAEAGLFVVDGT